MNQTLKTILLSVMAGILTAGCEFVDGNKRSVLNAAAYSTTPCQDAQLKSLSVSGFNLSPEFSPDTAEYAIVVKKSDSPVTVRAIGPATATVLINGVASSGPDYSAAVALDPDAAVNDVTVDVTAEDGVTTAAYTIHVHYFGTTAALSGLSVVKTNGALGSVTAALSPAFSASVKSYSITASWDLNSLDFILTMPDPGMTAAVDGWTAGSGVPVPITCMPAAGASRNVSLVVTSQDGLATDTYTITINKGPAPSNNANLSSVKLFNNRRIAGVEWGWYEEALTPTPTLENLASALPAFSAQFTASQPIHFYVTFTAVSSAVTSVKVNGVTVTPVGGTYTSATLTGPGSGDFFIDIVVTAQDGTTTKTTRVTASVL